MTVLREVQPYETLKAALDAAHKDFDDAVNNLMRNVNHKDGPMLLLIDIEAVFRAHAVVKACEDAFTREYTHMTEVNNEMRAQRDEANRKFESIKKLLKQFDLDDSAVGDQPKSQTRSKGRRRK